jgi:hypothetical protein
MNDTEREKMKPSAHLPAQILTYSGTLPLIACVVSEFLHLDSSASMIAIAYSAVIIAFISGIHWAAYLFFPNRCHVAVLASSNLTALSAWLALILPEEHYALLIHLLCFIYLLWLDTKLLHTQIYPAWFFQLRTRATLIVSSCLIGLYVLV